MFLLDSSFTVSLLQTFTGRTVRLEVSEVDQDSLLSLVVKAKTLW